MAELSDTTQTFFITNFFGCWAWTGAADGGGGGRMG